jgi:hypothetical protein
VAPREALVARQGRVIAEGEQGAKTEARALSGCRAIALPLP